MWIKIGEAHWRIDNLLNTDNIDSFDIEEEHSKSFIVHADSLIIGRFKTKEEAQAYLDKIAEKLGAVDIDKD
jgi:hypothetical protein